MFDDFSLIGRKLQSLSNSFPLTQAVL